MTKPIYNLANMRELLLQGFDNQELRRLCFDLPGFRAVYYELGRDATPEEIVDELLAYADKHGLIHHLLALARDLFPLTHHDHPKAQPPAGAPRVSPLRWVRSDLGVNIK